MILLRVREQRECRHHTSTSPGHAALWDLKQRFGELLQCPNKNKAVPLRYRIECHSCMTSYHWISETGEEAASKYKYFKGHLIAHRPWGHHNKCLPQSRRCWRWLGDSHCAAQNAFQWCGGVRENNNLPRCLAGAGQAATDKLNDDVPVDSKSMPADQISRPRTN